MRILLLFLLTTIFSTAFAETKTTTTQSTSNPTATTTEKMASALQSGGVSGPQQQFDGKDFTIMLPKTSELVKQEDRPETNSDLPARMYVYRITPMSMVITVVLPNKRISFANIPEEQQRGFLTGIISGVKESAGMENSKADELSVNKSIKKLKINSKNVFSYALNIPNGTVDFYAFPSKDKLYVVMFFAKAQQKSMTTEDLNEIVGTLSPK